MMQILTYGKEKINTIVQTVSRTDNLEVKDKDNTKEITLTRGLNTTDVEDELLYHSYIAEIFQYSNAAGRRDGGTIGEYPRIDNAVWDGSERNGAVPGQLSESVNQGEVSVANASLGAGYVHSNASDYTLKTAVNGVTNEHDETWAESIKITKPTGVTEEVQTENNLNMAVIIGVPVLVVLAGAIILITKFVIIKK